jgi:uncharacterized protein DUF748
MGVRRWLAVGGVALLVAAVGIRSALPELLRVAVVARVQAITGRAATLDAVDVAVWQGRIALRGFRLSDRTGEAEPFAEFSQLDLQLRWPALLRGHLWLREVVLRDPTVRVIRYPGDELNMSDLVRPSGETNRILDITVDRFVVANGTATLEDRALPEPRTWRSERMTVEAHNLSSRPQYGNAVATSVTGGAPVSVRIDRLRLYPIDLQATVTIQGLDLAMGQVYLPPDAPVVLDRGRGSMSLNVALEARDGLHLDAGVRIEDAVLTRRGGAPLARVPVLTATLDGLRFGPTGMALTGLALDGSGAVVDPSAGAPARFAPTTFRARVTDLTWPVSSPAGLDLLTRVEGRGSLAVAGTLRPPTAASDLRVRLDGFDLAPWARFVPFGGQLTGVAEADLRVNEPLQVGVPSRVRGMIAVRSIAVSDGADRVLSASRIEASALELDWPARLRIGRLAVREPRAVVERGRTGDLAIARLSGPPAGPAAVSPAMPLSRPSVGVDIGQVLVQDGAVEWRDQTITPPVQAALAGLTATVTGASWPISGPLQVRVEGRPTGGGQLQVAGRIGLRPFATETRVTARAVDLAPYQAYLGTTARLRAWTDLDLAVILPAGAAPTVRGNVALAHVEVRDGERTVFQVERAAATNVDVEWPRRAAIAELAVVAPWILAERDEQGTLGVRALLPSSTNGAKSQGESPVAGAPAEAPTLTIARLTVDNGGARVVDHGVAPEFTLDLRHLAGRVLGVSTAPGAPAQVDLTGQAGARTVLTLRGTVGPISGPLQLDLSGEVRGLAVPVGNPYILRYAPWRAVDGLMTLRIQGGVQGDALNARADVRLSRLQVIRVARAEGTPDMSGGLPLNLIIALMRDARDDISLGFPVSGRLGDPRFDFRDAIHDAIRTVAINAITLPVSWIGRLHVSADSQIERVEVDPIRFQPGSGTLTEDGRAQATRVAAFLQQLGEVRMTLTPVVSERDLGELRRQAATATVDRRATAAKVSREAATAQLFQERFPGRPVPAESEALLAALAESEASPALASALGAQRLATLRGVLQQAGVAPTRLVDASPVERPGSTEGAIEANLLEPEAPRRSQLMQLLQPLGGTTSGGIE